MVDLADLLAATGGKIHGRVFASQFTGFAYDSRILNVGDLFLAVKTDKADGHDYILDACYRGASGVLCQRPMDLSDHRVTCIVVPDVRYALVQWARYILRKYHPEVIDITGSTGKTSTKEAVAAVLATSFRVFWNQGNFNDRYGLPIALGGLLPEHDKAVLEIACDHFDEIRELASITKPRIGVVTAINPTHLEALGSIENVALEKGRLVEALPSSGYAVLNWDDERVRAMAQRTAAQIVWYSQSPQVLEDPSPRVWGALWAEGFEQSAQGISFTAHWRGEAPPVRMQLLGRHNVYVGLAALGVGLVHGVPVERAAEALADLKPLPGRLSPLPGLDGSVLLDDTYNASPAAVLAGLDTLAASPARRRIVVLGDMMELGADEEIYHRQVGRRAAQVADWIVTKGERARWIAEEALLAGLPADRVVVVYTAADASRALQPLLQEGDWVLLKGSAQARVEEITRTLLLDPSQAGELLVRQGGPWGTIRLDRPGRPTWVEVDLDAIANNVRNVVRLVGPDVSVMAVLKADAYGHGAIKTARTALNNGAKMVGVACLGEALVLRESGIDAPILVLGYTPPWQARETVLNDITATLFSVDGARALSRAATELRGQARAHIKVDTGMGRLGLLPEQISDFLDQVWGLPNLTIEGIFTHFAASDEADKSYTQRQLAAFRGVLADLEAGGYAIPYRHAANSAAILEMPETHFDMVRLGIAMYGLRPSQAVHLPLDFRPALSFKTLIAQVKDLPTGSYISYGCTFCTKRPSRIAVIPVGYADGFRRAPSHWGKVLVRGCRAPIVGRVCMDQTMLDVTDVPGVREGDEVVLIGRQGKEQISAEDVAERLGTINYEVISEILARVPRMS